MSLKGSSKARISLFLVVMFVFSLVGPQLAAVEADSTGVNPAAETADTQTLGDLEIGDRVVDNSWEWEHRLGPEGWDGTPYSYEDGDSPNEYETARPVTWIVVAKDHYDEGGVTLLSENIVARHTFDDSTDRYIHGSNHWGDSGTTNAEYGIRKFLNGSAYTGDDTNHYPTTFYDAFSESFRSGIIPTSVPTKANYSEDSPYNGEDYTTTDQVFLPSQLELGLGDDHAHSEEQVWEYFIDADDVDRVAKEINGNTAWYWTRSPNVSSASVVRGVHPHGYLGNCSARGASIGVRPALNLESDIPISGIPNEDGVYEIEGETRIKTDRLAGFGRFDTAVDISENTYEDGEADAVVLATGLDFPDALAGVPLAYAKGGPLLLTCSDELPDVSAHEIARVLTEGDTVYVLGGEAAVSEEVADKLDDMNYGVERIAGEGRFDTAVKIAEEVADNPATVFLTTGLNFADAVAASSPAAIKGSPILLTHPDKLSEDTADYLEGNEASIEDIHVIGGEAAVEDDVMGEAGGTNRVFGANRWETGTAIAEEFFEDPVKATLATGLEFPDALAGGVYAALNDAPVLLTNYDELPGEVKNYFIGEKGIMNVSVFGGEGAVSDSVLRAIEAIE